MDKFAHVEEYLDILDEKGEKKGESKTYDEIHSKGLLHLAVHSWIINSYREVLVQKRSKYVRAYPQYWNSSASGHVRTGRSSVEAAQAEMREEVGLDLPPEDFKLIATLKEDYVSNNGTHIENSFNDIYVAHSDLKLEEFKIEPDEVEEIRWLSVEEFKKWTKGEGEEKLLPHHEEEYAKLIEYLESLKN